MSVSETRRLLTPAGERPFASTVEKYNIEYASGHVTGSNFPHEDVTSLPGYAERRTPSLAPTDVTRELARQLVEYANREGSPLPFTERDVAWYLWMQASRGMLAWNLILKVARATRKNDRRHPISHYFGYRTLMRKKGRAGKETLTELVRYVTGEGVCPWCEKEFPFAELTRDRIKPRVKGGTYALPNVQLMCADCNNNKKKDSYTESPPE